MVIVWQVPHTIVLRYGLLVLLGLLAWPVAVARLARPSTSGQTSARLPFIALAAFLASALAVSAAKERILIAAMAGRAGTRIEDTLAAGLELEERARRSHRPAPTPPGPRGLLGRIKAHVAA